MIRAIKPTSTLRALYQFELSAHYGTLKSLNGANPVTAVARNNAGPGADALAYAKRFWHDVFQNFAELRKLFPDYAEQFGPYV